MAATGELVEMLARALRRATKREPNLGEAWAQAKQRTNNFDMTPDFETPPQRMRELFPQRDTSQADLFPESAPENPIVFHGTYDAFEPNAIRPWSHFGTEEAARHRTRSVRAEVNPRMATEFGSGTADRLLPYEITGRRIHIGDEPASKFSRESVEDARYIADRLLQGGHISPDEHSWAIEPLAASRYDGRQAFEVSQERLSELASRHDIGAIGYRNAVEDAGSTSYIIPNPRAHVAHRFPAFSVALGAGLGGGLTLREALRNQWSA